jgi:hypothetical protein
MLVIDGEFEKNEFANHRLLFCEQLENRRQGKWVFETT